MLLVSIVIAFLLGHAQGFFPTEWREAVFGGGGFSHVTQTNLVYDLLVAKYFPEIQPISGSMIQARKTIADANAEVDDDQTHSALHFDGENFAGGQQRLIDAKVNVIQALANNNPELAQKTLGGALHTLQDFYAHTNWVEMGHLTDIHPDLGKAGKDIAHAPFNEATCTECNGNFLITSTKFSELWRGCHDCDQNTVGFHSLTSGYYFGEDSPAGGVSIPDNKCHHGGATDNDSIFGSKVGAIEVDVMGNIPGGINKDSFNCFWSPHYFYHRTAADLAIEATRQYIEDIIAEGKLNDKQKRLLFGVGGGTLAFVIDTTGSMEDLIAVVQKESIKIAQSRLGTRDEPLAYIIAPFNDPTTGPVTKTTDFETFKVDILSLTANGGGDCPELMYTGVLDALEVMDGPGDIFILTDAAPKDFDKRDQVLSIAKSKKINIWDSKYASGCDISATSKRSLLEKRSDAVADKEGALIAAVTGGGYFSLAREDTATLSTLIDSLTLSDKSDIFKIADSFSSGELKSYELPVDSKMSEFSIFARGNGVRMNLTKADGSALDVSTSSVTLTTATGAQFINVKTPQTGVWTVTITGEGDFSCDAIGASSLHLSAFDFVALRGRPGHMGYFPIKTEPAYDHDVAAVAYLHGNFSTAAFDLRTPNNTHLVSANMTAGSGKDGAPPSNSFYGEMRLAPSTLLAYCKGQDDTGAPFQRVLPSVFAPILSNTTVTGFNDTDIFAAYNAANPLNTTSNSSSSSSSAFSSFSSTFTNNTSAPVSSSYSSSLSSYNLSSSRVSSEHLYSASSTSKAYVISGHAGPSPEYAPMSRYTPRPTGIVYTHSEYMTAKEEEAELSVYTTTSRCALTKTIHGTDGELTLTTTTTVSTVLVTKTMKKLCPTCIGANYPVHTSGGQWISADASVAVHGYNNEGSKASVPTDHGYTSKSSVSDTTANAGAKSPYPKPKSSSSGLPSKAPETMNEKPQYPTSLANDSAPHGAPSTPENPFTSSGSSVSAQPLHSQTSTTAMFNGSATMSGYAGAQFTGAAEGIERKVVGLSISIAVGLVGLFLL